ncbi:right-handed parallel beta-helix repeat-containing protein [Thalassobius sp. Cn5-15]|uniref:right-handed parallel beta-helix repeat-containing protein n=1 Tax=Thalassobius sp. Cn5-15 TaxID=2917763 RepID=UPI001EF1B4FC|nr:right-handed parallel beta-helix repeat-containing protein [Thalassobius sp. Cn5-15]MCG7492350.1 hypothetical protein [Thalassobius sp. Cn5-15]
MKTLRLAASGLSLLLGATCLQAADLQVNLGTEGQGGVALRFPFAVTDGRANLVQLNWQRGTDNSESWSAGLMHRRQVNGDWVLGLGGFAERSKDRNGKRFTQLGLSADALSDSFEARANAYLPVGKTSRRNSGFDRLSEADGTIRFLGGRSLAMRGIDFELGPRVSFAALGGGSMGLFGGGYVFDHDDSAVLRGATVRAEVRLDAPLTQVPGAHLRAGLLGERVSGNTDATAYVSLSIPLGGGTGTGAAQGQALAGTLTQDVIRRRHVTTQQGAYGDAEAVSMNGRELRRFTRVSDSGLAQAVTDAGADSLVFASGDFDEAGGVTLASGQAVVGGGAGVTLRAVSGTEMVLHNEASEASLTVGDGVVAVQFADGSGVAGVSLSGGSVGLQAAGVSNIWADRVGVSGTSGDGVQFSQVTGARLTGLSVSDVGGNAVSISGSSSVAVDGLAVARAGENGVLLRDSDGFSLRNASFTDMPICENNSLCEFSIFSPSSVPNSAVNAVGLRNAQFEDITMTDVTYGFFLGSEVAEENFDYTIATAATDISLRNVAVTNSRREAILAVAVDNLEMENITIDNSAQAREMDLVVIQSGGTTRMNNATLEGGVNGLMFVNGLGFDASVIDPDMTFSNITIDGASRAGIFLNPVHNVSFENVAISNVGTHGVHLLGDNFGFNGGPVVNVDFTNVSVENAANSGVNFFGPVVDATGAITVTNTPGDCAAFTGSFTGTALANAVGEGLTINGTAMTTAELENCTGSPF